MKFQLFDSAKIRSAWLPTLLANIFLLVLSSPAYSDDDDDGPEQDFLFLLEEAYTQEQGEWQFGFTLSEKNYRLSDGLPESEDFRTDLEIEYGITDRLQVEIAVPFQSTDLYETADKEKDAALGNVEVGVGYKLLSEVDSFATIAVGLEVEIGSNEKEPIREENSEYETFINLSRHFDNIFDEGWYLHANLGYGIEDTRDNNEFVSGLGFAAGLSDNWVLLLEWQSERESEKEDGEKETDTLDTWSLGVQYAFESGILIGLAYAEANDEEEHDDSISFKWQYEF